LPSPTLVLPLPEGGGGFEGEKGEGKKREPFPHLYPPFPNRGGGLRRRLPTSPSFGGRD